MEAQENACDVLNGECVGDLKIEATEDAEIVEYRGKRRKVDDGVSIKNKCVGMKRVQELSVDGKLQGSDRVLRSNVTAKTNDALVDDKRDNKCDLVRYSYESNELKKEYINVETKDTELSESHMIVKRKPGRPPKVKKEVSNETVKMKRKRGRPPKLENKINNLPFCGTRKKMKRKRGRPRKNDKEDVNILASGGLKKKLKKKRGRPPKLQESNFKEEKMWNKNKDLMIKRGVKQSEPRDILLLEKPVVEKGLDLKERFTGKNRIHKKDLESEYDNQGSPMLSSVTILNHEEWTNKVNRERKDKKVEHNRSEAKHLLRERIVKMLFSAGWRVEYRPRSSKEYLDAVYVSPEGRTHWSVTLAYNVLKKHYEEGVGDSVFEKGFKFDPIPEEDFSILKRLTKVRQMDLGGSFKNKKKKQIGKKTHKGIMNTCGSHMSKPLKGKIKGKSKLHQLNHSDFKLHKGVPKSLRDLKQRKTQDRRRYALVVRNANEGRDSEIGGFLLYDGKRNLLSWMVDLGTVSVNEKVKYMNQRRTRAKLEGRLTRDGIQCDCCNEVVTISKFETHAGSKLSQPFENIFLGTGGSLFQCLLDSWRKQQKSEIKRFCFVDVDGEDPNDDTCGICGDGGDLICCDSCPSTFHQTCLDIKKFPSGDWHCLYCSCKFCGMVYRDSNHVNNHETASAALCICCLCEEKYHLSCAHANKDEKDGLNSLSFCGKKCQEISVRLQMLLGVIHELEDGFSWTLIRRFDIDTDISLSSKTHQKVQCNSKLAVAFFIMDECFLPIIDHRSGINLIQNILYNCGSNFKRLDYGGFYTVILERGEEIISAASIRIHGRHLAEMPFIGTRYMYRRQGMCRRLLNGIESLLCSLNVEKLVIPAISELRDTWTSIFGFKLPEEASRQKMKNMSMLVFPGVDMLEKPVLLGAEDLNLSRIFPDQTSDKDVMTSDEGCSVSSDARIINKDNAPHQWEITNETPPVESIANVCDNSLDDTSDVINGVAKVQNCDSVPQFDDKLEEKNSSLDSAGPSCEQTEDIIEYSDAPCDSTLTLPDKIRELNSELTKLGTSGIESKLFKEFHVESEAPNCNGTSHSDHGEQSHDSKGKNSAIFQLGVDNVHNTKLCDNLETSNPPSCDVKDFSRHDSDQRVSESIYYLEKNMVDICKEHAILHNIELLSTESCSVSSSPDSVSKTCKIPHDVVDVFPATSETHCLVSCYSQDNGNGTLLEINKLHVEKLTSGSYKTNFNGNKEEFKISSGGQCDSSPTNGDIIPNVVQVDDSSKILQPDLKVNKEYAANCNTASLCNTSSGSAIALHSASLGRDSTEVIILSNQPS